MFAIVFQQVFIMFLLMLIGFVYAKATGMQKAECNRICNILLMIVTPCLLLSNLQRPFQQEIVKELLFSLGLAVVSSLFAFLANCVNSLTKNCCCICFADFCFTIFVNSWRNHVYSRIHCLGVNMDC